MEKKSTEAINYKSQDMKPVEKPDIKNVWGLFRTSSKTPTADWATYIANPTTHFYARPTKFGDQVVVYTNSTTYRLYWYDTNGQTWHYVTATA